MVCCLLRVWGSFLNYLGKAEASLDSSSPTSSTEQLCHPLRAVQADLIKHGLENTEFKILLLNNERDLSLHLINHITHITTSALLRCQNKTNTFKILFNIFPSVSHMF